MPHFLAPLLRAPRSGHGLRVQRTGGFLARAVETAFDSRARRRGLLGRTGLDADRALVIAPCSSIHTAFMRFPIDVVFVRRDGRVAKVSPAVAAWRLRGSVGAFAVIELAAGSAARCGLVKGDVIEVMDAPS